VGELPSKARLRGPRSRSPRLFVPVPVISRRGRSFVSGRPVRRRILEQTSWLGRSCLSAGPFQDHRCWLEGSNPSGRALLGSPTAVGELPSTARLRGSRSAPHPRANILAQPPASPVGNPVSRSPLLVEGVRIPPGVLVGVKR
jgi:hypothetical protein